jgi:formyltetrahydrofolate hydrolase
MKGGHKEYILTLSCPGATGIVREVSVEHRVLINGHKTVVFH